MSLQKLTDSVYYYAHQPETDRPMLAYIKGGKWALAIDAGNSAAHVDEFYQALESAGLKLPDLTVITHWHWDHTFGMHHIHGPSVACQKTNQFLNRERDRLADPAYEEFLKQDDECLGREYGAEGRVIAVPSDIQFEGEMILDLGGITARIFQTEAPHSEDTVLIELLEENLLFLGDSTSEDFYQDGYMDRGKLAKLIALIEGADCTTCILSHTEPLGKWELLEYLKSI